MVKESKKINFKREEVSEQFIAVNETHFVESSRNHVDFNDCIPVMSSFKHSIQPSAWRLGFLAKILDNLG